MVAGAGGGLVAIYGLDLGVTGFFAAVAAGFCIYAALLVRTVIGVRTPAAARTVTSSTNRRTSVTALGRFAR
jgi:hypothetical protein